MRGIRLGKVDSRVDSICTFALQALPEQPSQQSLAVLAHGGACVRVDGERVGHLHLAHQDLVQMDGPTCVEAPRLTGGPWLTERSRIRQ